MAAVLKRKKVKAHMARVYVVDEETWDKVAKEQGRQAIEISGYKIQVEQLKEEVASQAKTIKGQGQALAAMGKELEDRKERYEEEIRRLFNENEDLKKRLKSEERRAFDALSAFDSVAKACDSTAMVSNKIIRFFDSLDLSDLDIVIRPKEGKG